ncbi:uncharacterized protein UV8b_01144 [Ustilaginoidea virens]|uniref:GST N-terminal domain-containing protein n=1 Tax=Ustilaginoidea virens TaxID=1159556 RepID=A0A063C1W5_USTVR|nr:uncharacterized protein UV8b_01144 [Ustilaginoidea virens]QUC16903.1 hypothetical protein UV8b_01144 [Ustilaginoidea virens]GAO19024.1 hypothetical protein UVI_02036250 [Ustilaginoidea virens]
MSKPSADCPAITFYDIAQAPPVEETCYAPNPWKTRFALNFKAVPYSTQWVGLLDIEKVRRQLGEPPCRQFADGSDFYTLPVVRDATTGATVGDSLDIALYLQRTYPDSGAGDLLPAQTLDYSFTPSAPILVPLSEHQAKGEFAEYARFNASVDAAFTMHVPLMAQGMLFDPAEAEEIKAKFARRAGVRSWDDVALAAEARRPLMDSFRDALTGLAELFARDGGGPFALGERASYADFIVGGWLRMAQKTLPRAEWDEVRGWHGGVFARLHDALDAYAEVK